VNRPRRATTIVAVSLVAVLGAMAVPAFAASNKQIAKASTLQLADLSGTDWTSTPHAKKPDSKVPSCAPTNKANNTAEKYGAHSPDFKNSTGTVITNAVYVFPTVKQAKAYIAAFKLPTAQECLQQGFDKTLQGSGATATVTALDVSGAPKGTFDDGVGFQGLITGVPASENGGADLYLQAAAFRVGRAITGLTTTSPGANYPDTAKLVLADIARLKNNLK